MSNDKINASILVVDDDIDMLVQTRVNLESAGYSVVTAASQKEAEQVLETCKPDLAVLDLMMENQDSGFVLAYKIKKANPGIPVIIVTAVNSQTGFAFDLTDRRSASWIKADAFLEKEIRFEQLLAEVRRLLEKRATAAPGSSRAGETVGAGCGCRPVK